MPRKRSKNMIIREAAEHFAVHLYNKKLISENGTVLRSDMVKEFLHRYQPRYCTILESSNIGNAMRLAKLLKNDADHKGQLCFNLNSIIKVLDAHPEYRIGGELPKVPSISEPIEMVFINQSLAFRKPSVRSPAVNVVGCQLCFVSFKNDEEYNAHLQTNEHRVKDNYRLNRLNNNTNIEITVNNMNTGEPVDCSNIVVKGNELVSLNFKLSNKEKNMTIQDLFEIHKLPLVRLVCNATLPCNGQNFNVIVNARFDNEGDYVYPLVFRIAFADKSVVDVLRELKFHVGATEELCKLMEKLCPKKPYRRAKGVTRVQEGCLLDGLPLEKRKSASLLRGPPLLRYDIPNHLHVLLNQGLKHSPTMTENMTAHLNEILALLGGDTESAVQIEKYKEVLHMLTYIEECDLAREIHNYDREDQVIENCPSEKHLHSMKVEDLAETRPSLMRGDKIIVQAMSDKGGVRYEGVVHKVQQDELKIGFHKAFGNAHKRGTTYHVQFCYNRLPFKLYHWAIDCFGKNEITSMLFPKQFCGIKENETLPILKLFNDQIAANPSQVQAVQYICAGTSHPAPYLLFGPPGTGKTSTTVEAVTQIWYNKPLSRILICTPSNAACDEVAKRLLVNIPIQNIYRIYAMSQEWSTVDPALQRCCNFHNEEIYYPSINDIMNYRVILTTLVTANRLHEGSFTHIFIDESGQCIEPEALIAARLLLKKGTKEMPGQLVLLGDPKQLGPVLHSQLALKHGFGKSLLERLMLTCDIYQKDGETSKYNPCVLTKLLYNFRSHHHILKYPNSAFYDNELEVRGKSEIINLFENWVNLPNSKYPVIFHSVQGIDEREGNSPSYFNRQEIATVLGYINKLIGCDMNGLKIRQEDIGIITPYRKQVLKIKIAFDLWNYPGIKVGSVEQFQGQERKVIIVSTVRSRIELLKEDNKFNLGFLSNPKRFNVAVTRAQSLLILIGNPMTLSSDPHWLALLQECRNHGSVIGMNLENAFEVGQGDTARPMLP